MMERQHRTGLRKPARSGATADVTTLERTIASARTGDAAPSDPVSLNKLERVRYVAPVYPEDASARGRAGTVDSGVHGPR